MTNLQYTNQTNKQKGRKKTVCLPLFIKAKAENWASSYIFFEYLKTQSQKSIIYNYTAVNLYTELKSRGYTGTLRTVQRHIRVLLKKDLAYKKDFHLFLVSEKKCYQLAGCNHKIHSSKYLADLLLNYDSFDIPELIKDLEGKNDPENVKYTPGRIKNNIRHLSAKGFLRYDSDRELYELRKELYNKRNYKLINQFKHTVILTKQDSIETIKDKIITATLKLASEQKKYFVNTDLHSNRLHKAKGRKKTQSEVRTEKAQSNGLREFARFTNYSISTVQKYINRAIINKWVRRYTHSPEILKDQFS